MDNSGDSDPKRQPTGEYEVLVEPAAQSNQADPAKEYEPIELTNITSEHQEQIGTGDSNTSEQLTLEPKEAGQYEKWAAVAQSAN